MGISPGHFCSEKKDVVGRIFAFVRIGNGVQAEKTIRELNGQILDGRSFLVNPAHFKRNNQGEHKTL